MATNFPSEGSMGRQISYLHEDPLLLVLARLPAKTLLRFKCVSRSWNALISDPKFKKMHLDQSRIDPNPNLLLYKDDREGSYSLEALTVEYSNQENLTANIHRLHYPFDLQGRQPRVVGSCNGLLCLLLRGNNEEDDDMILYNPLIKSFFKLPKRFRGTPLVFCGFGYDDAHDDYKVIIMVNRPPEYEFEVYRLRSNSWTTIIRSYQEDYRGGLVNRALHWLLINNTTGKKSIVAFDLKEEKHRILPVPEVIEKSCFGLVVLDGCLLVKSREDVDANANASSCHLWVMKDYGLKDSWMRITTHMPYHIWINTPMSLLEGKRKMVFYDYNYNNGMILLYDLVNDQVLGSTIIPGCHEGHIHKPNPCLEFVGSLVQPWLTNEN